MTEIQKNFTPPVDENEPDGLLAGNPKKIKERIEEEFGDDYGEEKPKARGPTHSRSAT